MPRETLLRAHAVDRWLPSLPDWRAKRGAWLSVGGKGHDPKWDKLAQLAREILLAVTIRVRRFVTTAMLPQTWVRERNPGCRVLRYGVDSVLL